MINVQTLATTGTYTVWVQHSSSYKRSETLRLYTVPADTTGTITIGGSTVGVTTTAPGQNGSLTFSASSGQHVTVAWTSSSYAGTYSNPTYSCDITLKNPDGSTVVTGFCGGGAGSLGSVTLGTTATYTIFVDPQGATTGSVTLQVTSP